MKICKFCNCKLKGNEKFCSNCGQPIKKRNSDLRIIGIIVLIFLVVHFGHPIITSKIETQLYSNPVVENDILIYLNKKYNDNFEIVDFVQKGQLFDVVGNGITFYDDYIDGTEYVEYIAKSKTTNIPFKVTYSNYREINYCDFYLVKYAEKVYNEKINNLKFNPHIELDMNLNPQYIYDLDSEYYSASNLNISFDDLYSIDYMNLKYNLIYYYPSEIGVDDEILFSEFISSINEVKKTIGITDFGEYITIKTKNPNISIRTGDGEGVSYISVFDTNTRRKKVYYYTENGYTYNS